jgi:hypothetical protein
MSAMAEEEKGKSSARKPQIAITVDVPKQSSAVQTKQLLIDAINSLHESELRNLRTGVITVIA